MGSKTNDWENQILCAISEEEPKEGEIGILDWEGNLNPNDMRIGTVEKISPNFEIRNQYGNLSIVPNDGRFPNNKKYKVVVATDKDLTYEDKSGVIHTICQTLLFDESFINKYVERYNFDMPITEIELEMENSNKIKSQTRSRSNIKKIKKMNKENSNIPNMNISSREIANNWWNKLSLVEKAYRLSDAKDDYHSLSNDRKVETLTGREVEIVYKHHYATCKECNHVVERKDYAAMVDHAYITHKAINDDDAKIRANYLFEPKNT